MIATWFVMVDGSCADPSEVSPDDNGVLRHKDGRAVAMRGDVPRSRSVEVPVKEMRPQQTGPSYLTRESGVESDLSTLRSEYHTKFGKKPFAGWDAATLREKIKAE